MLNGEDYKEPSCLLCGGKDFYNPNGSPQGRIPVARIIEKVNALFDKNDYEGAGKLLEYWQKEALSLGDKNGELSIDSELIGFYRKTGKKDLSYNVSDRAVTLIDELQLQGTVSAATVLLNIATAKKAFGNPKEAAELYSQVEKIYLKRLDKNDVKFAGLYNNAALALTDLKEYEKAEDYYLKAIRITSETPENEPDCAISYVNLAHLYYDKGENRDKIDDCLYKAYELLNKDGLNENGYLAYVLSKCAPSFGFFGFTVIEKEFIKRSEKLYERA